MKTSEYSDLKAYQGPLRLKDYKAAATETKLPLDHLAVEALAREKFNRLVDTKKNKIDQLTGLLRRDIFMEEGSELVATVNQPLRYEDPDEILVIGFDVVGLKAINETVSYAEGSKALGKTGKALQGIMHRKIDIGGRLGGDEFAVMIPFRKGIITGEEILASIEERLSKETQDNSTPGLKYCAAFYEPGKTLEETLETADPKKPANKEKVIVTPSHFKPNS